ncbi:MAG: hypothetical protein COU29_03380 [Candidatus Magasanikbacteria bacterium CG10_big_fil_rev_8_21_14_0_10_36_32]|uniref:Uncharacterized protein n=1 Tax=Candidatus Magasanikbacteria bacterium CG10_big_fil_rev_8_21_14_0_10_36_32 TaxID=1974646 RepID=A0A2M6W665_9BACT|nr:MAG: hypothetical protein COU29_03380 [Candidatus Magasanikbacteria bacterium CG10_big_fil_rev_8_21_14_0_10_36_32]
MFFLVLQRLFFGAVIDILYFPIWWYIGGTKHAAIWCLQLLKKGNDTLAPALWLQNIFVPMYGQYDWQGRIISFLVRSAQVFVRSLALVLWLAVCWLLLLIWLAMPLVTAYGLLKSVIKL